MKNSEASHNIKAIEKIFKIIEYIAENDNHVSLTSISKDLGIGKSTVYGLISTLENLGYIKQEESNGKYTLGLKFFELGEIVHSSMNVKNIARPYLEVLVEKYGETVHLGIFSDDIAIYLDKVNGPYSVGMMSKIGGRAEVYCSGLGKALISELSDIEFDALIKKTEFRRYTKNTITDSGELKKELALIRKQGYAIDDEEIEEGLKCVAAPIRDNKGRIVAAVSLSGPTTRMNKYSIDELADEVENVCSKVSSLMGYKQNTQNT